MRWISIVGAIGLAGCITHNVSKAGPFVRDIQSGPNAFVVISCVLVHDMRTNYAWWWIGENASKERTLEQGQCWKQPIPKANL